MAQQTQSASNKQRQIISKGYLMKQGNLLNKSFKKKYFILYQGRTFTNFETEECVKQIGEIDLSQVSSITYRENIKSTSKYKHVFDVITPSKTWTLGTIDKRKCEEWIIHLRESAFGNTLFNGWLYKRGGKVQSWKHRFFVLSDTKILRYYEDEECSKYKGSLSLSDVIKIQRGDPLQEHDNIIYMTTSSRIWCISASSKQSQHEWIEKLNDGQNQINYDEKASIFVNIMRCRGNVNDATCLAIERIQFVCRIYLKWMKSHQKKLRASIEQRNDKRKGIERANTIKIQSYSSSISDSKDVSIQKALSLDLSHKYRKGMFAIINNDLKDYNNIELLNDLNHILEHHDMRQYMEEKSDEELPLSVLRTFRSRCMYSNNIKEEEELYFNYNDIKEIATQQLLDKIYSYLNYTPTLTKAEIHELHHTRTTNDEEYYIDDEKTLLLNTSHLLSSKRLKLRNAAIKDKLELRLNKFIAPNVFIVSNNSFGNIGWLYWETCKNEEMYCSPKYSDLREELLNNSLCNISLPQLSRMYDKCCDLHSTDRALIIGAFCGWKIGSGIQLFVRRYGIDEGTPIKINHILSCVIYCNYYSFAEGYRSTYTQNGAKHNEFAHFSRYLVECILVFGTPIKHKSCLYHAIDGDDVILHDLSALYIAPISMTRHFEVAWSYTDDATLNGNGLIVKLIRQDNLSAFNMDCSWLSDFVFECEHIAVANTEPMRVDTIINMAQYSNYKLYIYAINSLSNLLSSTKPFYCTNMVTKKVLNKIIRHKQVPHYIDILFRRKCLTITAIECDLRQIFDNDGCYCIFRSLLIDPNDDWIKIDLFVMLFPNLTSITIRCFNHLIFNDNTCTQLCKVLKSKIIRIEFKDVNIKYDSIKTYCKAFKIINYELRNVNDSIIIRKQENNNNNNTNDAIDINDNKKHKTNDDEDCLIM